MTDLKKPIKSHKVIYVDVDDTLIMWDTSLYPNLTDIQLDDTALKVNKKNINLVIKLAKLDYSIVIWSQSGWDWAEKISKAVGLDPYVHIYLTKPRYYVDDLPATAWMGERLWRDPVTGKAWDK